MGSVVDLERRGERVLRVYVTGDTLCGPELREIRERFPGVDVMITHLGGTRVLGILVTMDDRRGTDLVDLVGPATVVPVHHDDHQVFRSPLGDFVEEVGRRGHDHRLRTVARGETVLLAAQDGRRATENRRP